MSDDMCYRLLHVLRVKPGYKLAVFNPEYGEFLADVESCNRHKVILNVLKRCDIHETSSPMRINLVQGISKSDKMDWAIQKACELGVSDITPLVSAFSQIKKKPQIFESKERHWEKVIVHAAEQSGRLQLPKLHSITAFHEWFLLNPNASGIYLSPRGDTRLSDITIGEAMIHVFVGGEGGFSEDEEQYLEKAGFKSVNLGPRVLRTETASTVALTLLQYLWGDLKL